LCAIRRVDYIGIACAKVGLLYLTTVRVVTAGYEHADLSFPYRGLVITVRCCLEPINHVDIDAERQ